jgi:hypothetical protein
MLSDYLQATNDSSILSRALPLAEVELAWWHTNRTLNVTSPYTNNTYEVARYAVNNTAPRPESYFTGKFITVASLGKSSNGHLRLRNSQRRRYPNPTQ